MIFLAPLLAFLLLLPFAEAEAQLPPGCTVASTTRLGCVKVDGTTITISAGVISAIGAAPTGTAGGDLSGTYPNPTVAKIGSKAIAIGGALTFSGAFATTITVTGTTGVTLPTSGTLAILGANTFGPANQIFNVGASQAITLCNLASASTYNMISFSGGCTLSDSGILGGTDANIYLQAATGGAVSIRVGASNAIVTSNTATTISGATTLSTSLLFATLADSATAPTIASGGCTTGSAQSISSSNGTAAFAITLGGAACGSTITLTLPAATTKWHCTADDITTPASSEVHQTAAASTTSVVLTNYVRTTGVAGNFTAADVLLVSCRGQ